MWTLAPRSPKPDDDGDGGNRRMNQQKLRSGAVAGLALLALVLFAVQLRQVLVRPLNDTDFRYVWLAGEMWSGRGNPYGPGYIPESIRVFGADHPLLVWVYPFQWFWIAVPFAALPPLAALHVWQAASYLLVGLAASLALRTAALLHVRRDTLLTLVMAIYVLTFNPLAGTLQLGQPVMPAVFGFAVLTYGMAVGRDGVKLTGVVLLALKPQFGVPVLLMLCTAPGGFRLCVIGGLITAALAVPPLLLAGAEEQVRGLLANIGGSYDGVPINQPISMVGLPHLLALTTGVQMPISVGLLIAAAVTTTLGVIINRHRALTVADRVLYSAAFSASAVSCLVGVHPPDLAVVLVTLPLLLRQHRAFALVGVAGYVLLWRFENVARIAGLDPAHGNTSLATAGVFLIGASWTLDFSRRATSRQPAP